MNLWYVHGELVITDTNTTHSRYILTIYWDFSVFCKGRWGITKTNKVMFILQKEKWNRDQAEPKNPD